MVLGHRNSTLLMKSNLNFRHFIGLVLLMLLTLLSGCSTTTSHRDGPPPFDVDESKIPDATPKSEKLAKYGNMSVYRVYGKPYHVMKTAHNYHEQGIASWYGTKFHEQRTSSGERYNMLAMTAAHKTLPLPTYVEVTNLKNKRKIIVKVNDRGPFASNRIIDLSYVAAKKLGMIGHGTTYVNVKAIDPLEAYRHPALMAHNKTKTQPKLFVSNHTGSSVYLQVGAFKNRQYAEKLKSKLSPMVTSPIEITRLAKTPASLYRVKIGPFEDVASADTLSKKLRSIGLTAKHIRA